MTSSQVHRLIICVILQVVCRSSELVALHCTGLTSSMTLFGRRRRRRRRRCCRRCRLLLSPPPSGVCAVHAVDGHVSAATAAAPVVVLLPPGFLLLTRGGGAPPVVGVIRAPLAEAGRLDCRRGQKEDEIESLQRKVADHRCLSAVHEVPIYKSGDFLLFCC